MHVNTIQKYPAIALIFITALICIIYYPGINGPFVFDDYGSILDNSYIKIKTLDAESLYYSSFSVAAGPLNRPIANLSFALNYYFGNGIDNASTFKITNIIIHIICSYLVFFLTRMLLNRYLISKQIIATGPQSNLTIIPCIVTLIWAAHPINLTSVLYVVQRMTSLSAGFSILAIILYISFRNSLLARKIIRASAYFLLATASSTLALYSKENAVLIPVFILIIELWFFNTAPPMSFIRMRSKRTQTIIYTLCSSAVIAFALYAFNYAESGYSGRSFSMLERIYTESRVLCLYLSLILLPRIDQFGLFHDDIAISTSLLSPWSTGISIIIVLALIYTAILKRNKLPLFTFGIIWFFVGHLLESTIFALEIAHEHRNYLASFGIIFAAACLPFELSNKISEKKYLVIGLTIALIVAATTWLRSSQWVDYHTLAHYEAHHHPKSASAQSLLSNAYYKMGDLEGAKTAILKAAENSPDDASSLLSAMMLWSISDVTLPSDTNDKILSLLKQSPPSASAQIVLTFIGKCISTSCAKLQPYMEQWLTIIIDNTPNPVSKSVYQHLLGQTYSGQGRTLDALNAFQTAHNNDPMYAHPLFEMAGIFLSLNQIENAEFVADKIKELNKTTIHPRENELGSLLDLIAAKKYQITQSN